MSPLLPLHELTPEQLLPPLASPISLQPDPPIPHHGTFLRTLHLGVMISLKTFAHRLSVSDLQMWGCSKASQLLANASPDTWWVYLDGSEKLSQTRSAAILLPPTSPASSHQHHSTRLERQNSGRCSSASSTLYNDTKLGSKLFFFFAKSYFLARNLFFLA